MRTHIHGDFRHAAAKDDTSRYARAALEIRKAAQADRVLVSATDGRILAARLQVGQGPDEPLLVPADLITTKAGAEVTLTGDDRIEVRKPKKGTSELADRLEGTFPPIADVLPAILPDVADLDAATSDVDSARRLADKLKADRENGSPNGDTLDALAAALDSASEELAKSHHHVVGLSAQLLYNLARALHAGEDYTDNLGVHLILPRNPAKPINVLPTGSREIGESIGVIMPMTADKLIASRWERIRGEVLDTYDPERVVRRDETAARLKAHEAEEQAASEEKAAKLSEEAAKRGRQVGADTASSEEEPMLPDAGR